MGGEKCKLDGPIDLNGYIAIFSVGYLLFGGENLHFLFAYYSLTYTH